MPEPIRLVIAATIARQPDETAELELVTRFHDMLEELQLIAPGDSPKIAVLLPDAPPSA